MTSTWSPKNSQWKLVWHEPWPLFTSVQSGGKRPLKIFPLPEVLAFLSIKVFSILSFCCCLSTFTTHFQATGTNICSQFVIMFVVTYNLVPRPIWWKCVSRYFRRNGKDSFSETGLAQIVLSTEENFNSFPASILVGSLHLHFVFVEFFWPFFCFLMTKGPAEQW